ncbi:uncharacterized protein LOC106174025 [Lingula anatina]|uniref:Uncharacterized protein LOC106174025 n=1 Tax=Lingula anatina TaxID=7574 RepID=A0A1S3JLR2_LINAN|nr:uncharacterized protein LOC106174025 [Lingula anatina]|eukprot:XP_013410849.1 uncharacterized protein LOC106174025 [Lingula anatina]
MKTPPDGDCFFRSFVRAADLDLQSFPRGDDNYPLNEDDKIKEEHSVLGLRRRTADYMRRNTVHYEELVSSMRQGEHSECFSQDRTFIITDEGYSSLEEEIDDISRTGVYATHLAIDAAAHVEGVVIHVFQLVNKSTVREITTVGEVSQLSTKEVNLLYKPGPSGGRSGHYDVLYKEELPSSLPLTVNDYVLVKYGAVTIPAVVVREGNELTVRYFDKDATGRSYTAQEFDYEILAEDVSRKLVPPTMEFRGSRIYYTFSDI